MNKSGVLLINKPMDMTSHDAVALIRRGLKTKRVGHTGTLDPNATGLLLVCVGGATKIADLFSNLPKEYKAELRLGLLSDTQDIWGNVTDYSDITNSNSYNVLSVIENLSDNEVIDAFNKIKKTTSQITPMFSAKKIDGEKLLDKAIRGENLPINEYGERLKKNIKIESIDVIKIRKPYIEFVTKVSKGTYVRTICHDIGMMLGTGAVMTKLKRTEHSGFTLEDAISPFDVNINSLRTAAFVSMDDILMSLVNNGDYGRIDVNNLPPKSIKMFNDGVKLNLEKCVNAVIPQEHTKFIVFFDNLLFGLAEKNEKGVFIIKKLEREWE